MCRVFFPVSASCNISKRYIKIIPVDVEIVPSNNDDLFCVDQPGVTASITGVPPGVTIDLESSDPGKVQFSPTSVTGSQTVNLIIGSDPSSAIGDIALRAKLPDGTICFEKNITIFHVESNSGVLCINDTVSILSDYEPSGSPAFVNTIAGLMNFLSFDTVKVSDGSLVSSVITGFNFFEDYGQLKIQVTSGIIAEDVNMRFKLFGVQLHKEHMTAVEVKFKPNLPCTGFDGKFQDPPTLAVVEGRSNTVIAEITPATTTPIEVFFESANPSIATVSPTTTNSFTQLLTINGLTEGQTQVNTRIGNSSAQICSPLIIPVYREEIIQVAFHLIADDANNDNIFGPGDFVTAQDSSAILGFVNEANDIWDQYGVKFNIEQTSGQDADLCQVNDDFMAAVDLTPNTEIVAIISQCSNVAADVNIFFVKELNPPDAADTFPGGLVFIQDSHPGVTTGKVLAHEIGHVLGIAGDYSAPPHTADELMWHAPPIGCEIIFNDGRTAHSKAFNLNNP